MVAGAGAPPSRPPRSALNCRICGVVPPPAQVVFARSKGSCPSSLGTYASRVTEWRWEVAFEGSLWPSWPGSDRGPAGRARGGGSAARGLWQQLEEIVLGGGTAGDDLVL